MPSECQSCQWTDGWRERFGIVAFWVWRRGSRRNNRKVGRAYMVMMGLRRGWEEDRVTGIVKEQFAVF